jgi:hypothetical protein
MTPKTIAPLRGFGASGFSLGFSIFDWRFSIAESVHGRSGFSICKTEICKSAIKFSFAPFLAANLAGFPALKPYMGMDRFEPTVARDHSRPT